MISGNLEVGMVDKILKNLDVLKLTIGFSPQEMKEGVRVYTMQAYFSEDEGLAPYPNFTPVLSHVVNVWKLTDDLAIVEHTGEIKVISAGRNTILASFPYRKIKTAIGLSDIAFAFVGEDASGTKKLVFVLTDVNYSSWTVREFMGDPSKAISSAVISGRLFLLLGNNNVMYSTPSLYDDVITGRDPFDFTRGAGFLPLESSIMNAKMLVPYLDSLYVIGTNNASALILVGNPSGSSPSDMGISVNYFYEGVADPFQAFGYGGGVVAISKDGAFMIQGYRSERIVGITGYLQQAEKITGGGYFYMKGYRGLIISSNIQSYLYFEDFKQWTTHPLPIVSVFTLRNTTYALSTGGVLYKMFDDTAGVMGIKYEIHIPVDATRLRIKDIKLYGQELGRATIEVQDITGKTRSPMLRRADDTYQWWVFSSAVLVNKIKMNVFIPARRKTRLRSMEVVSYAGQTK